MLVRRPATVTLPLRRVDEWESARLGLKPIIRSHRVTVGAQQFQVALPRTRQVPFHSKIGQLLPSPGDCLRLDHSKSAMLEKGTRGDAGFGEEAGEPTCLGRRFEPMQKPAGNPAALEIRIHIEHVDVALGLEADEAHRAFP